MKITLFSFGFKHAYPEADTVFDVRFLPNPYWVDDLRSQSGRQRQVAAYVLDNDQGLRLTEHLQSFLSFYLEGHQKAGREDFVLAVGCTGGRHRSVAVVEFLQKMLADTEFDLNVYHRDIDKE